jgi:CRISPR-associated endonuclease/helicase Cas3
MSEPTRGHTAPGRTISDAEAQRLADEAKRGYSVDALIVRRCKRGRPALGSAPAVGESVRLDPELRERLAQRAEADGMTASEIIRHVLRDYLHVD